MSRCSPVVNRRARRHEHQPSWRMRNTLFTDIITRRRLLPCDCSVDQAVEQRCYGTTTFCRSIIAIITTKPRATAAMTCQMNGLE